MFKVIGRDSEDLDEAEDKQYHNKDQEIELEGQNLIMAAKLGATLDLDEEEVEAEGQQNQNSNKIETATSIQVLKKTT